MDTSALELRFRIGSIPVTIEPWFWLAGVMFGANLHGPQIVLWLLVMFVSILVHELGHALTSIAFGARARILLHSFGGLTFPSHRLSRWRDVAMTLAGPGAGFLLGAAAFGVYRVVGPTLPPLAAWTLLKLVYVNVAWGLMNLLPIPPLDGGHVLLGVVGRKHERTARIVAVVVAGLVVLYGLSAGQLYLTIMFGLLAFQNVQVLRTLGGR